MLVDTGGTPSASSDSDLEGVVKGLAGIFFVKDLVTLLASVRVLRLARMVESGAHLVNRGSRREPRRLVLAEHELEDVVAESGALVGKVGESVVAQEAVPPSPDEGGEQALKACVSVNPIVCGPDGIEQLVHVSIGASADLINDSMAARLGDIVATNLHQLLVAVLTQEGQCVIG